jgi:hypothetical protein
MCNPIAIGVASGLSSYIGQQQIASAQEKAQARASQAEQERARRANTALRVKQAQEGMARSQRKEAAQIQTMEAQARARLIALTEAGVAGMSLDRITDELTAKQARYEASEERQLKLQEQQTSFELEENALRTHMNQLRINQPIKQASLLESGIEGLQTGLSTAKVFTD